MKPRRTNYHHLVDVLIDSSSAAQKDLETKGDLSMRGTSQKRFSASLVPRVDSRSLSLWEQHGVVPLCRPRSGLGPMDPPRPRGASRGALHPLRVEG